MKKLSLCALILAGVMLLCACGKTADISQLENKEQYVTVGTYKGVQIKQSEIDKYVQQCIDSLIKNNSTENKVTDRACKMGDTVKIDYVGCTQNEETQEWEMFKGGSASGSKLELGSGTMIDGFEEGIVGMKIDETKEIMVTFPDPYKNDPSMSGVEARFTITLHSITEVVAPELSDAFIAEKTTFKTVDEYKADRREVYLNDAAVDEFMKTVTVIEYPDEYVEEAYNTTMEFYQNYASMYGMSFKNFCKQMLGQTEQQTMVSILETARETIKNRLALLIIAEKENLTVTDEEYKTLAQAEVDKSDSYDSIEALEEEVGAQALRTQFLMDKATDLIVDNVVIVDDTKEEDKEEDKEDDESSKEDEDTSKEDDAEKEPEKEETTEE